MVVPTVNWQNLRGSLGCCSVCRQWTVRQHEKARSQREVEVHSHAGDESSLMRMSVVCGSDEVRAAPGEGTLPRLHTVVCI